LHSVVTTCSEDNSQEINVRKKEKKTTNINKGKQKYLNLTENNSNILVKVKRSEKV